MALERSAARTAEDLPGALASYSGFQPSVRHPALSFSRTLIKNRGCHFRMTLNRQDSRFPHQFQHILVHLRHKAMSIHFSGNGIHICLLRCPRTIEHASQNPAIDAICICLAQNLRHLDNCAGSCNSGVRFQEIGIALPLLNRFVIGPGSGNPNTTIYSQYRLIRLIPFLNENLPLQSVNCANRVIRRKIRIVRDIDGAGREAGNRQKEQPAMEMEYADENNQVS